MIFPCRLLGARGQASVTDTIYFLLIISVLCVFMFAFANQYGAKVAEEITLSYYGEYTTSALKTILYSSTSRNTDTIYDADAEIDHLFALLKEDFADNADFEERSEDTLANDIKRAMAPVSGSFDYVFYIYNPGMIQVSGSPLPEYLFLYFHKSDIANQSYTDYICEKPSSQKLEKLISSVGANYRSSSMVRFPLKPQTGTGTTFVYVGTQADLIMWVSTKIAPDAFDDGPGPTGWECRELI